MTASEQTAPQGPSPVGPPPPSDLGASGRRTLALRLITIVLIVGASTAFLRAQSLKLEPSPLDRSRVERIFSPTCRCDTKATATLAFSVTRPLSVDAEMIDARGRRVRRLAAGARWDPGRRTLQWDGRDDAGRIVGDGAYRLRVRLLRPEREIVVPTSITVDTTPPRARLLSVAPRMLPQARDGRPSARPITLRYEASEGAAAALLVDGRVATRRSFAPAERRSLEWGGRARGRSVAPGRHTLSVVLRDRAGNLGPATDGARVRVLAAPRRR